MYRDCRIIEKFCRIHLRPIRRFYGESLFSNSANSILKISIDNQIWRDEFDNRFYLNYLITTTKNVTNNLLVSEMS